MDDKLKRLAILWHSACAHTSSKQREETAFIRCAAWLSEAGKKFPCLGKQAPEPAEYPRGGFIAPPGSTYARLSSSRICFDVIPRLARTRMPRPRGSLNRCRPRRARIEEQCLAEPLRFRLMGVTEDADIWMFTLQERPPFFRHRSAFVENMTHGNATTCQFNNDLGRNPFCSSPSTLPETAVTGAICSNCSITHRSPMSPAWRI